MRVDFEAFFLHATFQQTTPLYWDLRFPILSCCLLHTWSLAIEEQFYLFWPLVVTLAGPRWIAYVAGFVALNSLFFRAMGGHPWTLLARCDGLAMGAIISVLQSRIASIPRRMLCLKICLAIIIFSAVMIAIDYNTSPVLLREHLSKSSRGALTIFWINAFYAGTVGSITFMPHLTSFALLRVRWLRAVGLSSYGVYIWGYIITYCLEWRIRSLEWRCGAELVLLTGCLGVGWLSWRLIEKPVAELKVHWPYRRVDAPQD